MKLRRELPEMFARKRKTEKTDENEVLLEELKMQKKRMMKRLQRR